MKSVRLSQRMLVGADLWHDGSIDQDLAAKQAKQDQERADIRATYKGVAPGDASVSKGAAPSLVDDATQSAENLADQAARTGLFGPLGMLFSSNRNTGPIPPLPASSKLILGAIVVAVGVVGYKLLAGATGGAGGQTVIVRR